MAGETVLTIVGQLTADPELRYTQSGVAVAGFTVAFNPRVFDREQGGFVDGKPVFMRCSVWREQAENLVESQGVEKGTRVIVQGRIRQDEYTDREGNQRSQLVLDVDEVGPTVRFATAAVQKVARGGGGQGGPPRGGQQGGGYSGPPQGGQGGGYNGPPRGGQQGGPPRGGGGDPWAGGTGWTDGQGGGGYDDPPFS